MTIVSMPCGQYAFDFFGVPPVLCGCGRWHYEFEREKVKVWMLELDPFRRQVGS